MRKPVRPVDVWGWHWTTWDPRTGRLFNVDGRPVRWYHRLVWRLGGSALGMRRG